MYVFGYKHYKQQGIVRRVGDDGDGGRSDFSFCEEQKLVTTVITKKNQENGVGS